MLKSPNQFSYRDSTSSASTQQFFQSSTGSTSDLQKSYRDSVDSAMGLQKSFSSVNIDRPLSKENGEYSSALQSLSYAPPLSANNGIKLNEPFLGLGKSEVMVQPHHETKENNFNHPIVMQERINGFQKAISNEIVEAQSPIRMNQVPINYGFNVNDSFLGENNKGKSKAIVQSHHEIQEKKENDFAHSIGEKEVVENPISNRIVESKAPIHTDQMPIKEFLPYMTALQTPAKCLECQFEVNDLTMPGFQLTEPPLAGAWFHDACFVCEICSCEFNESCPFVPFNGRAYCEEHYRQELAKNGV